MKVLSLTLLLMVLIAPSYCFWSTGHMIISRIAYEEIQKKDPAYLAQITKEIELLTDYSKENAHVFVESAVWADDNKGIAWGAFSDWHFVDTPVFGEGFEGDTEIEKMNATWAIYQMRKTLSNKNKPKMNNALAISFSWRYLIHLVGDIHQPLHASTMYSAKFPNGDRGGNSFKISYPDDKQVKNLHALWDACVGQFGSIWAPVSDGEWNKLGQYADQVTAQFPRNAVAQRVKILDERVWAKESNQIAQDAVYADITPDSTPSAEYIERGRKVVNEQLAVAGYRLADLILTLKHATNEESQIKSFLSS